MQKPLSPEWQKMLDGELYDPLDPALVEARQHARRLCTRYNRMDEEDGYARLAIRPQLFGSLGSGSEVVPPFHCDYGVHILAGAGVYINTGCVVLDCNWIKIGDRVLFGPGVHIYGATHPLDPATRARGRELAFPVTIGDDVWIGGAAIICAGVTIGEGTTIGAGSVVTRDIPASVLAVGSPCRVVRSLVNATAEAPNQVLS